MRQEMNHQGWDPDRTRRTGRINRSLVVSALLFILVLAGCLMYAELLSTPMESYDFSPGSVPERWMFQNPDGRILAVEDGNLEVSSENSVVVCQIQIPEELDDMPLVVVSAIHADCVFIWNGHIVYSPTGRYQDGQFSDDEYERSSASGQFALRNLKQDRQLTMIAQLQGEERRLSRLPKITFYPGVLYYLSQYIAPVSEEAMAAGVYFTIAIFVTVLFLIGLWRGKKDPGMILTAVCSLSMAFRHTNVFAHQTTVLFYSPAFVWFCDLLPQLTMTWLLWYRMTRPTRLRILIFPAGITGWILTIMISGFNNTSWNNIMNLTCSWVLPGILVLLLTVAALEAIRGQGQYRRFFRYVLWALRGAALAAAVSSLMGGKIAAAVASAWTMVVAPYHSFFQFGKQLCSLLLLVCFFQASLELIQGLSQKDAELRALSLREKSAVDNLMILRQSQEETSRHHHEMKHHMVALEELMSRGKNEQALEYIHRQLDEIDSLPQGIYSENLVINALAGYYLNQARAEGIQVDTKIRVSERLPIRDEELCVLLANLLENALEACHVMGQTSERFIALTMSASQEHLMILCENSTDRQMMREDETLIHSSKSDPGNHGYGIPSVRQIVNRYCGILTLSCRDQCFRVELSI